MNKLSYFLLYPTRFTIHWLFEGGSYTNDDRTWGCPECGHLLVPGAKQQFETLLEHVSDPNYESHPLRETWVCPNDNCRVCKHEFFFADGGDIYMGNLNGWTGSIPGVAIGSMRWFSESLMEFEKTKLCKVLYFEFRSFLCLFGLHSPIFREEKFGDAFCSGCGKEMGKSVAKWHPLRTTV